MYMRMSGFGAVDLGVSSGLQAALAQARGGTEVIGSRDWEVFAAMERQRREQADLAAMAMRAKEAHERQQRVAFWSPWGIVLGVSALGLAVMAFSSGRGR